MERSLIRIYSHTAIYTLAGLFTLLLVSCSKDDSPVGFTGQQQSYRFETLANQAASGTVTFKEQTDGSTQVVIELSGTTEGNSYPARLYFNSIAEGGTIAADLATVDGASGRSTTVISKLKSGAPVTYSQLIELDGHIQVHPSPSDLVNAFVAADIGGNQLTDEYRVYPLTEKDIPGANGTVRFAKRRNGNTLITITISGTTPGIMHPAHLHHNTVAENGAMAKNLNPVDGSTGISRTNLKTLDDGFAINYDQLVEFNGFIRVHYSASDLNRIVALGNIGSSTL